MKLWSAVRVKAYKAALQRDTPATLAILRSPRLELEVPVYDVNLTGYPARMRQWTSRQRKPKGR